MTEEKMENIGKFISMLPFSNHMPTDIQPSLNVELTARIVGMLVHMESTRDSRLGEISELFGSNQFRTTNAEGIVIDRTAEAVVAYVKGKHPDLHDYLQQPSPDLG